jgi:nicotinamidase-related amidase
LDAELRHAGITTIEFAGVQSELCLRASVLGARALGYEIVVKRELHGSFDSEDLKHSEVSDQVQKELMPNG